MSQKKENSGFFGSWIGKGVILGIAGAIILIVAVVFLGAKITGVNVGPIQLSLEQGTPQSLTSGAAANPQEGVQAQTLSQQNANNANNANGCSDSAAFWLAYPDQYYYEPMMSGFAILYSYDGFAVWDPNYYGWGTGEVLLYPVSQVTYNQWLPLINGHFDVCVSNAGNGAVYARFNG